MSKLLLYHYSTDQRKVLLTRAKSTTTPAARRRELESMAKRWGRVGIYIDHISFFFEPIPRDLGSLYAKHNHPTWKKGQVLYEHVVDITPVKFAFEIVETPHDQEYIRLNWKDEFMDDDKEDLYDQFALGKSTQARARGDAVNTYDYNAELLRVASGHYVGQIRDYYIQTLRNSPKENLSKQYATAVPHVMLYPEGGKIDSIVQVNKIVLS